MTEMLPTPPKPRPTDSAETSVALLSADEVRLLAALGFSAARMGQVESSVRIFEALAVLRPTYAFPFIGMALAYLAVGKPHSAIELLAGRASLVCPGEPDIQLYLSLALHHAGCDPQAATTLRAWEEASGKTSVDHTLARTIAVDKGDGSRWLDWPVPAAVDSRAL